MGNAFRVQVINPIQDLLEELGGLFLCQRLLLSQEVEQLSARDQLEDQHYISLVLKDVMKGNDVGVLDLPQDIHLPLNLLTAHPTAAGR